MGTRRGADNHMKHVSNSWMTCVIHKRPHDREDMNKQTLVHTKATTTSMLLVCPQLEKKTQRHIQRGAVTVEVGHQCVALNVRALIRHGPELDRVLRLEVHRDRARRLDVRKLLHMYPRDRRQWTCYRIYRQKHPATGPRMGNILNRRSIKTIGSPKNGSCSR